MRLSWLLLALVAACVEEPRLPPPAPAPPPPPVPSAPAPVLPPGVLAELPGEAGPIRVEERDGLRVLTIAGVVQGGAPMDRAGAPAVGDPMVALVRGARPHAKRALVVGLGTGRTAAELAKAGFEVEVAEREPGVIDLARRFFGYEGHAVAADGPAYLKERAASFNVVLLDAGDGGDASFERVLATIGALGHEARSPLLFAARLLRSPAEHSIEVLRRRTFEHAHFVHLFGSGVGNEPQNLYLLASARPLELVHPEGIAAWPIPERVAMYAQPLVARVPGAPASRRVTLLGYLVRAREDGALCLDLPHEEMGALRYRLAGPGVDRLGALLPPGFEAPTDGDIGSDGDTKKTLRALLGGGGWKRSDVRFSPVLVAVRGVATVAAIVHPDAAEHVPRDLRGGAPADARLPWGGVLYDLAVEEVSLTYDRAAWLKLAAKLAPIARRAAASAEAGDLAQAAKHLDAFLAAIGADAGDFAQRLALTMEMYRFDRALAAEAGAGAGGSPFARAAACDRAREVAGAHLGGVRADADAMREALRRCAERGYDEARKRGDAAERRTAAGRLLALIQGRPFDAKRYDRDREERERIQREQPDATELYEPPPR